MMWQSDELTPREEEFIRSLRRYAEDIKYEYFDAGYDEGYEANQDSGWDEGRNKGYDEGWEDACEYILDTYVSRTGFIVTPESIEQVHDIIEHQPNIAAAAVLNFLHKKISNMKVEKE